MKNKTLVTLSSFIATLLIAPSLTFASQDKLVCPPEKEIITAANTNLNELTSMKTSGIINRKTTTTKYSLRYSVDDNGATGDNKKFTGAKLEQSQSNATQCVFYLGRKDNKGKEPIVGKVFATLIPALSCPPERDVMDAIQNKKNEIISGPSKTKYTLTSEINPDNIGVAMSASLDSQQSDNTTCTYYITKKLNGKSSIIGKAIAQSTK